MGGVCQIGVVFWCCLVWYIYVRYFVKIWGMMFCLMWGNGVDVSGVGFYQGDVDFYYVYIIDMDVIIFYVCLWLCSVVFNGE